MKKLGIIGGGIILSAALMVSSAGVALASGSEVAPAVVAAAQGEQKYQGIFGTVAEEYDPINGIVPLITNNFGELDILLDEDTTYKVPGKEDASVDDIVEGSRLAILAIPEENLDYDYTAVRVMVVTDQATYKHMYGVVVSNSGDTLKLMSANGETCQVNIPMGIQGGEVGQLVSVAVQNRSDEGPYVACGLVTATQLQTRLQTQLNETAGEGAQTQAQIQTRERLTEQLEGLVARHMRVLNDVLEKAPLEAQEFIRAMIDSLEQTQLQFGKSTNESNADSGGQNPN